MNEFWTTLSGVALAIVGVATIAVLVSKNANTVGVITASGNAFSQSLGVAISPVTGSASSFGNASGGYGAFPGATATFPIG